jgi:hypothetical protein
MKSIKSRQELTLRDDVEDEKAFIRDVVSSTPKSRADVILGLARRRHIDPEVWDYIGRFFRNVSAPALDFFANQPTETQRAILQVMKKEGAGVHAAILKITGEVLSDDAVYAADLLAAWENASSTAKEIFLRNIGEEI